MILPQESQHVYGDRKCILIMLTRVSRSSRGQVFEWALQGSATAVTLAFRGTSVRPKFEFDVDKIHFGTVSFGFLNSRMLTLTNTSEVPCYYTLMVKGDEACGWGDRSRIGEETGKEAGICGAYAGKWYLRRPEMCGRRLPTTSSRSSPRGARCCRTAPRGSRWISSATRRKSTTQGSENELKEPQNGLKDSPKRQQGRIELLPVPRPHELKSCWGTSSTHAGPAVIFGP